MSIENIKKNYLISSIEDINKVFLIEQKDKEYNFGAPILPLTEETIFKCWKYKYIEGYINEEPEVFSQYGYPKNVKIISKEFDFDKLEKNLNLTDFKKDIKTVIEEMDEYYLTNIQEAALNSKTEFQLKELLNHEHNQIKNAITQVKKLKLNKIQQVVADIYLESFTSCLISFEDKYSDYIRISDKENEENPLYKNLSKYIFDDNINELKELEQKLIDNNYLTLNPDSTFSWIGKKTELVDFVRVLRNQKYPIMREKIDKTKGFKFFEERYNTKLNDLRKKSKYKARPLSLIFKYDFLFE